MKVTAISFFSLAMVITNAVHGVTIYQFDRGAIAKHAEQELLHLFQPLEQKDDAIKRHLENLNNRLIVSITDNVKNNNQIDPFKDQAAAKKYANFVAQAESILAMKKIAKRLAGEILKKSPQTLNSRFIKREIKNEIMILSITQLHETGRLTRVLQNLNVIIKR